MNRKDVMKAAFIGVALILVLVILYSGLQILESTVFYGQREDEAGQSKWIVRDGVHYYPRQDIVVVLLMGIDREGVVTGEDADRGHTADMIALLIFDEKVKESQSLPLNRDTMVMMSGLNAYGKEEGRYYSQLALSHAYGTGREDNCENVRNTVSDLLYGITIDYYVSMNMGGIAVLNDAVGGVTVQVTDDFSAIDPSIGMGEVTLHGQQAVHFVRTRKGLGDQLNLSRIERHKTYFDGLMEALQGKLENSSSFALSLYDQMSPYIVTDCSVNALTGILERYADYELVEIVSTEGENARGAKYMEFYLDEEKLDALILRLFYEQK